jgi:methylated-DNA-[protein]-cysteine S-methyltransferase
MITRSPTGHRSHQVLDSPIGPLTLVAADGRLAGVYMELTRHQPSPAAIGEPAASLELGADPGAAADPGTVADPGVTADPVLAAAASQLQAYFAGQLTDFDLPLSLDGSDFQRTVWASLQTIGYGETISYGQLADRIGQPSASRAVGLANGRNPVSIIVPCHRVIGADGSLTGYGGGLDRKRYLLSLEQRVSGQTLA